MKCDETTAEKILSNMVPRHSIEDMKQVVASNQQEKEGLGWTDMEILVTADSAMIR